MAAGATVTQALQPALTEVSAATGPLEEIGLGLLVLITIIAVHGLGVARITARFSARLDALGQHTPSWRFNLLTSTTIALLAVLHLIETLVWAVPIHSLGMLANFRDAWFFALESYTTLGSGDVVMPDEWRLVGPIIAISGLFAFSWTGSVLVYTVTETARRLRRTRRPAEAAKPRSDGKAP